MNRWIVAGVLATLAGSATGAQCPDGSPPPCAASARRAAAPAANVRARRFLLLPFRNVTRKAGDEWLAAGAPLMLAQVLGQFSDLGVVAEEQVSAARRRMRIASDATLDATQLRALADETGGWTAITGNVFATGSRLRLTAQSMDVATSRVVVRAEADVAADADPREAIDRLAVQLLAPTGVPPGARLAEITTRSIDAFRAYAAGMELFHRSRHREAEAEFARAVRLDSSFALAWMAIAASAVNTGGVQVIANPASYAYRAIEQAARLSTKLPPRDAAYIRAIQSLFRGAVRRSRRQLDSLLAANPSDLDVAFWLASSQILAPPLDTTVSPPRLESHLNRSIALATMILDRDPARRTAYSVPVLVYAMGAGIWWGDIFGYRREFSSFGAALMTDPDAREVPVARGDTLVLVTRAAFDSLPLEQRIVLRRRSADAAWQWVERWLVAGPEDAEAHLWAAHVAELRGDFQRAQREFTFADSLGIQTGIENVLGLRLSFLVLAGDYTGAASFADSLLAAGRLTSAPFLRILDRRRAYGAAALLLAKRWDSAARMAQAMSLTASAPPVCASLRREMIGLMDADAALPAALRRAVMDTVSAYQQPVIANPVLRPCADELSKGIEP